MSKYKNPVMEEGRIMVCMNDNPLGRAPNVRLYGCINGVQIEWAAWSTKNPAIYTGNISLPYDGGEQQTNNNTQNNTTKNDIDDEIPF
jgi:hypothetical protein